MGLPFALGAQKLRAFESGFTLLEISIVLVIIGLIVGGILVGQSLVSAAGVRATITQIEKYNQAVNTFYGKYGYLPGDIPAGPAAQFGFAARGPNAGQGDGNGIIEGAYSDNPGANSGFRQSMGEVVMFWVDLTYANGLSLNLIDGSFQTASSTVIPGSDITGSSIALYFPQARLGTGNYIYVYSYNAVNYFGLSQITKVQSGGAGEGDMSSTPALTVAQAYAIDSKLDDGLPQSGRVEAWYANTAYDNIAPTWAGTTSHSPPYTTATPGSPTTCFDNGNTAGAVQQYSVEQNGGSNVNCALSFVMQGAGR